MTRKTHFSVLNIVQRIRQEIYSSIESMVQTWQKRLEEDSVNPPATYQKLWHHQPKANQDILYELPKNNPANSLKEKQPQRRIYSRSETAPQSKWEQFSFSNTLYEVKSYRPKLKANLFYENTKTSTDPYLGSLNFGYQKSNSASVNNFEKIEFQYSSHSNS